jgi:prophage regulatory protein
VPRRPEALLALPDVMARVAFKKAYLYRLIGEGRFPRPIKFGATSRSASRWRQSDIDKWLASLKPTGEQVAA